MAVGSTNNSFWPRWLQNVGRSLFFIWYNGNSLTHGTLMYCLYLAVRSLWRQYVSFRAQLLDMAMDINSERVLDLENVNDATPLTSTSTEMMLSSSPVVPAAGGDAEVTFRVTLSNLEAHNLIPRLFSSVRSPSIKIYFDHQVFATSICEPTDHPRW